MKTGKVRTWLVAVTAIVAIGISSARADDALSRANAAVSNILFEYDGDEFASFSVDDDGYLDITFARNTPDPLYGEILEKLRQHPDIKGVMPGKGGPVCGRF
jgi:hypothetical protein